MSRPFKAEQVVRCPLCRSGGIPAHVGEGVMICEACGNRFRVVHANPGATGRRLGAIVEERGSFFGTGKNAGRR